MSSRWRRLSQRVYGWLLRAYPAEFRDEFGGHMDQTFRTGLTRGSLMTLWFHTFTDWLASMPREQWDVTRQDLRYACRTLARSPLFTLVVVACLALGIGANTAMFSFANYLLFQPLTTGATEDLATINRGNGTSEPASWLDYLDYNERNHSFSQLAAYAAEPIGFGRGRRSDVVMAETVTDNYFAVLGVTPAVGRLFRPGECPRGCASEVILSHRLWQEQYAGDPGIVGKEIPLSGLPATVIGVAPEGFHGTLLPFKVELWIHVANERTAVPRLFTERQARWLAVAGRLKPGVQTKQAEAELNLLDRQMQRENRYPEREDRHLEVSPMRGGIIVKFIRQRIQVIATLMMAVVGLVLLIACANVANLVLARATARRAETGVRLALGASQYRLVRQQLTESVLLSLLGGAAGLLVSRWLTAVLLRLQPPTSGFYTYRLDATVDVRVWLFAFGVTVLSSLLFGLMPAWRAARADCVSGMKAADGIGRRRFAARNILVVCQVAMSLVLLITAGLFLRSMRELQIIRPGFATENGLIVPLNINLASYAGREAKGREFYRKIEEGVRAMPGVRAMSFATYIPLSSYDPMIAVEVDGMEPRRVAINTIEPGYLELMKVPLLRGRNFGTGDTAAAPAVALVDETMARQFWPGRDPIGATLRMGREHRTVQIAGVVRESLGRSLGDPPRPAMFVPHSQNYSQDLNLIVRTEGPPAALIEPIRREIERLDDTIPIHGIRTFEGQVADALWLNRIGARVMSWFGLLALVLAAVGIYGVIAYNISRRTREIGLRIALGARVADVIGLVVRQSLRLTLIGIGAGLILAMLATRVLARQLYGVSALDPWVYAAVPLLWIAVALLASWLPARRATQVQPQIALRYD